MKNQFLRRAALPICLCVFALSFSACAVNTPSPEADHVFSLRPSGEYTEKDFPYRSAAGFVKIFFEDPAVYDTTGKAPEYLEAMRYDETIGKQTKIVVAWEDFAAAQYVFSDETVAAAHAYHYTFRIYEVVDGKNEYSAEKYRTPAIFAYNMLPICDFAVVGMRGGADGVLDVRITGGDGNAPFIIGPQSLRGSIGCQPKEEGGDSAQLELVLRAVSYDNADWLPAKQHLYILLGAGETVYLRLSCGDGAMPEFGQEDCSLSVLLPYLYNEAEYDACPIFEIRCDKVTENTVEENYTMQLSQ